MIRDRFYVEVCRNVRVKTYAGMRTVIDEALAQVSELGVEWGNDGAVPWVPNPTLRGGVWIYLVPLSVPTERAT